MWNGVGWRLACWVMGAVLGPAAGAADEPSRLFLWELYSESSASYLLGSLHAAQEDLYPLPDPMETAFADCDTLVVEADIGARSESEIMSMILSRAVDPRGRSLTELLDDQTEGTLQKVLERHQLPLASLERFRPWYVSQLISVMEMQRLGIKPEYGIDRHFLTQARGRKSILELEGLRRQLALFSGLSDREQGLMLQYTLRDIENLTLMLEEITTAWRNGDAERLDRLLNGYLEESQGLEDVFDKLFQERNRAMVERIQELLRTDRRYFIVVGAGHIVGPNGLLQLLREAGVSVRQVSEAPAPAHPAR